MAEPFAGFVEQIRKWDEEDAQRPPVPNLIRASHKVPYGRVFRQWDARGRLMLWVNRGELHDRVLTAPAEPRPEHPFFNFGIDVVFDEQAGGKE